jgi:hypothetical protein
MLTFPMIKTVGIDTCRQLTDHTLHMPVRPADLKSRFLTMRHLFRVTPLVDASSNAVTRFGRTILGLIGTLDCRHRNGRRRHRTIGSIRFTGYVGPS